MPPRQGHFCFFWCVRSDWAANVVRRLVPTPAERKVVLARTPPHAKAVLAQKPRAKVGLAQILPQTKVVLAQTLPRAKAVLAQTLPNAKKSHVGTNLAPGQSNVGTNPAPGQSGVGAKKSLHCVKLVLVRTLPRAKAEYRLLRTSQLSSGPAASCEARTEAYCWPPLMLAPCTCWSCPCTLYLLAPSNARTLYLLVMSVHPVPVGPL